jgi:hypothetical protein
MLKYLIWLVPCRALYYTFNDRSQFARFIRLILLAILICLSLVFQAITLRCNVAGLFRGGGEKVVSSRDFHMFSWHIILQLDHPVCVL